MVNASVLKAGSSGTHLKNKACKTKTTTSNISNTVKMLKLTNILRVPPICPNRSNAVSLGVSFMVVYSRLG